MAKLLIPPSPHVFSRNVAAILFRSYSPHLFHPSTSHSTTPPRSLRRFCAARDDAATAAPAPSPAPADPAIAASELGEDNGCPAPGSPEAKEEYPTGEFFFREISGWRGFLVKLRLLFALPWERVRKGSVLSMKLRGQISDKLQSRFSPGLSLPQICENFTKAAYDPRIVGIYLQIEPLTCGWGKVDEIRRSILNFKQSGKFIVGYMPICGEKEYYIGCACGELFAPPSAYVSMYGLTVQASFLGGVLEKVGIEPQIQRIGKFKSAGDQLSRKTISKENFDMLSRILDNIYANWLGVISASQGRSSEDIENFINEGIYKAERLKDEGFLTDLKYDDEVVSMLQKRLGQEDKTLQTVDYRKYAKVRKWSLGLAGGKDIIAIIRASGSISRVRGPLSTRSSGVIGEQFIEKIRSIRESKKYKAVIIRIDSPGGDALASDLMWREIRLLANSIPVVASMSDVAASGGYYMAMAAGVIVAENLTLTGSIGVVTGRFNLKALYERIGFNKETISKGRFAELLAAEQRPFRPDEAELFAKSAQNAYKSFRDKAALSRSMPVEQMEEVAQGRVWTGNDAVSVGLVDAVGGMSRAIAIAKQKANIPQEQQVTLVEVSKPSPTLPEIISGIGSSLLGVDKVVNLLQDIQLYDGVQARMDGILFERLEEGIFGNPILSLVKDYLGSL